MSYTSIVALNPHKQKYKGVILELHNSHGFATAIWDTLTKEYINPELSYYNCNQKELWDIARNTNIPSAIRAIHMLTFDDCYILNKDFEQLTKDINDFNVKFPNHKVIHLNPINDVFSKHIGNKKMQAIAFHPTSIGENPWEDIYIEKKDKYKKRNWNNTYSLYDTLNEYPYTENNTQ